MLPHYSPFKVAETFSVLAGLFPGRIDLGIGRARGHRPADDVRAPARPPHGRRPTTSRSSSPSCSRYLRRRASPPTIRSRGSAARCPAARSAASCGCSAPRRRARSGPRSSACPTRSPTSSTPRARRSPRSTARASSPPSGSRRRASRSPCGRSAPTPTRRRSGCAASGRMTFTLLRQGRLIPVPPPEKALRFLEQHGRRPEQPRPPRRRSARPRPVRAGLEEVALALRRRGGDRRHDHLRPRGAPALLRADRRGVRDHAPQPRRGACRLSRAARGLPGGPARLDGVRGARALRARGAGGGRGRGRAARAGRRARDRRARARLRRHLPARHRAPERAGRAGGDRGRRRGRARPSATCSTPTRAASRRWARSRAPATPRSTTAAGIRPRSAAASARRSRPPRCSTRPRTPPRPRRAARGRAARRVRLGRQVAAGRARGGVGRRRRAARGRRRRRCRSSASPPPGATPTAASGPSPATARPRSSATGSRRGRAACRPTGRSSARSASGGACPTAPLVVARPPGLAPGGRLRRRRDAAPGEVLDPLHDRATRCCTAARASTPSTRSTTRARELASRIEVRTDPAPRRVGVRAARRRRGARAGGRGARVAAASARRPRTCGRRCATWRGRLDGCSTTRGPRRVARSDSAASRAGVD